VKSHESGQCVENPHLIGKQNTVRIHFNMHFLKEELSKKIYDYHKKNEYFTISDLLNYAKLELEYTGGKTTLNRIIKSMGYKFKKVNGGRILCNTSRIKYLKIAFLRKYLQFCNSPNPPTFVYLDESWIFQNGCTTLI
jgi:hypothetical protein